MPIHWTISHPDRLVTAVCEGAVDRTHVEDFLDSIVVGNVMPYGKIFDLAEADWRLNDADMMTLGARVQAYAKVAAHPMGPLAIVAVSEEHYGHARMFDALGEARRPLKIFRNLAAARRWLEQQGGAA